MIPFTLAPQLHADSLMLGELELCQLRLMNDARFVWLLLIPRVAGACEWFDLDATQQALLHQEVMTAASRLKHLTACDKINIASLGNVVAQLHVHVIARRHDDALWPRPVWGSTPLAYEPTVLEAKLAQLRTHLLAH